MKLKIIFPSIVGNIAEWYEFALYGYCVPIISKLFFPHHHSSLAILAVYSIFAAGFLLRPLGGLFFGYYGDKQGRSKALAWSVILIGLPTFLMGLLPTYASIGEFATVFIIVIRIIQGVSIGGEFSGSLIYLCEQSHSNNRGYYSGVVLCSAFVGMLLASLVIALLNLFFTAEQYQSYGWRIAFLLGIVIAVLGFLMRREMPDTDSYKMIKNDKDLSMNPVAESLSLELRNLLLTVALTWLSALIVYIVFIYLPQFSIRYLHISHADALINNTFGMLVLGISSILFGSLSDRWGRKRLLFISALCLLVFCYPIMYLIIQKPHIMKSGQMLLGLIGGAYLGPSFAAFIEMFPTKIRYTSVSLAYNIGFAIFAGTAPLLSSYFITITHDLNFPAYYISAIALLTLCFIPLLKETSRIDLKTLDKSQLNNENKYDIKKIKSDYTIASLLKLFAFIFLPTIVIINFFMDLFLQVGEIKSLFTDKEKLLQFLLHVPLFVFLGSLIIATLTCALTFYFLNRQRTIQAKFFFLDLIDTMNQSGKSDDELLRQLVQRYQDESVGLIANMFSQTMKAYKSRQQIESELAIAEKIQFSRLPENIDKTIGDSTRLTVYAKLNAARTIGGDMYDFYMLNHKTLIFAIGDGCGKGIPGCLLTSRVSELFRIFSKRHYHEKNDYPLDSLCANVHKDINQALCANNQDYRFVTMIIGIVDIEGKMLFLSNAGHEVPYLLDSNGIRTLSPVTRTRPLGINNDTDYKATQYALSDNCKLFFYTDGITEAKSRLGDYFGEARLEAALIGRHMLDAKNFIQAIMHDAISFSKGVCQADDITALCIDLTTKGSIESEEKELNKETPLTSNNIELNQAAVKNIKALLSENLSQKVSSEVMHDMYICVEEYVSNLEKYSVTNKSRDSYVIVEIYLSNEQLQIHVCDMGIPFDLTKIDANELAANYKDSKQKGGRGLLLLKQLLDDICYRYTEKENLCIMVKRIA